MDIKEQSRILRLKKVIQQEKNRTLELERDLEHWAAMKWMAIATPIVVLIFAIRLFAR